MRAQLLSLRRALWKVYREAVAMYIQVYVFPNRCEAIPLEDLQFGPTLVKVLDLPILVEQLQGLGVCDRATRLHVQP